MDEYAEMEAEYRRWQEEVWDYPPMDEEWLEQWLEEDLVDLEEE